MRVHQPGHHLTRARDVKVDDWSWARTARRVAVLARLARPYRGRVALAVVSLLAATGTTLIIAHRLSTISLADEIVVLEHGRVVARGVHEDLLERSAVYRDIHEHGLIELEVVRQVEEAAAS